MMAARDLKPQNRPPGEPAPNSVPVALELPESPLPRRLLAKLRVCFQSAPKRTFYYEAERAAFKLAVESNYRYKNLC